MSHVKVHGIWAEELFEWLLNHVCFSGGDGAGAIVCQNYRETAQWFLDWHKAKYPNANMHPWHEYNRTVNFHDANENFIFTDDISMTLHKGDYVFFVFEDCQSRKDTKCIKAIQS